MTAPEPTPSSWLTQLSGPLRSSRSRPVLVALIIIATLASAGGLAWGFVGRSAGASEVFLEPAGVAGPGPFVVLLRTPATVLRLDPASSGTAGVATMVGDMTGLYGGSMREGVCDKGALATFLEANPAQASAWAQVQGIPVADIRRYVDGLTGAQLRLDVRVTNHGYDDGRATPRQSVLEAGTAVLVDDRGVPRVRCYCGNPLAPPVASDQVDYVGPPWEGFDETALHRISSGEPLQAFELFDAASGETFLRPVGTDGEADQPLAGTMAAATTRVPTVLGLDADAAERTLTAMRFRVTVEQEASDLVSPGMAIRTSPPADSRAAPGARVTLFVSSGPSEAKVTVPPVVGLAVADARQQIEARGLRADTRDEPSGTVPPGVVVASEPPAGASASTGSAVTLVVSSGPQAATSTSGPTTTTGSTVTTSGLVAVPDVRGRTEAEATGALAAAGLGTRLAPQDAAAPVGSVVGQDPAPATSVRTGTVVVLAVSAGLPVPDVVGLTSEQAAARAQQSGLAVAASSEPSRDVPAGVVLRQSPAPGTRVGGGATVAIVVSSGPSGPAAVTVPDVVQRPRAEAEETLRGVGLTAEFSTAPTAGAAPGTVLSQTPSPGTPVAPGSVVSLTVAGSVAPPTIQAFSLKSSGSCPNGTMDVFADWSATGAGSVEVVDLSSGATVAKGGGGRGQGQWVFHCFDSDRFVSSRTYRLVARASGDASVTATADRVVAVEGRIG